MKFKIIFILILTLYQTSVYSKVTEAGQFNQKYLSNYFSALLSSNNQNNNDALKYFESSKFLIQKHDNFLKEYVYSLVLDGQIKKAIKQVKHSQNQDFFEARLLLALESFNKKNYKKTEKRLNNLESFKDDGTYEFLIYKIFQSYNNLFLNNKVENIGENFGKLNLITKAFQNCYLNSNKTRTYFLNIINSEQGDYSRYLFFYLGNLIENKEYKIVNEISQSINVHNSSLLISQAKNWIEQKKLKKFDKYFSCKNEKDILAEFFFLISNLFSSEDNFEQSNFYLNLSIYLNPKFYFNLSLLAENYYNNENLDLSKKILNTFNKNDEIYEWYKTKKIAQILNKQEKKDLSLKYIEEKFKNLKNPSIKILYDLANIYKNFKKYNKAIDYYSIILSTIDKNSLIYADVLYRRGGSYERIGEYKKSDTDLLNSLEIRPDHAYTMNYLAYSWLERNYKIDEAIKILEKAYKKKENDPYITDSVGWGYYLIGDYKNSEKYLRKAVQLLPDDPIANDHYGDVLWQLNRKLQAKYFWQSVLDLEETDKNMKKKIKHKLLNGLNNI